MGYDRLDLVGTVSVEVLEYRDSKGGLVRGVVIEVEENRKEY